MAFDSLTFAAATAECKDKLIGGKITKINQIDRFSILMKVYSQGKNYKFYLSAHPTTGHFALTEKNYENPQTPPVFCMLMRKHLENGKIIAINQSLWDRILTIDIQMTDETGLPDTRRLILEIMGKHSNIIITHPDTLYIYDGIKRYSLAVSRHREILPGRTYIAPPTSTKPLFCELTAEELALACTSLENTDIAGSTALMQTTSGISPFLATEIIARAGIDPNEEINAYGAIEYAKIKQAITEIVDIKNTGNFTPTAIIENERPKDFTAITLTSLPSEKQTAFPTMQALLDYFYETSKTNVEYDTLQKDLTKIISTQLNRLTKKIALQNKDLNNAENAEKFKEYGNLLSAYLYMVEKGMENITLPSFYEEKEISIPLQKDLTPQENITRCFHKYTKAKNSKIEIEKQIETNIAELEYVESVNLTLDEAKSLDDLIMLKAELAENGYVKIKKSAKTQNIEKLEPIEYRLTDGHIVLVGRNNKQNDLLTLKKAGKEDIWFHTQKIPGSHVIIRREGKRTITDKTLLEAAQIAAYHSKGRTSENVPVDYTTISQVKKPKGAKTGIVIYFQQKTLHVTPKIPK